MTRASPAPRDARAIDVSIIVVSYNTRQLTLDCLSSIAAGAAGLAVEIIVVDNASTDGSADAIAVHDVPVHLIRLQDNVGFAVANNIAARAARGEFILLLNPDTVVLDHAIARLVGFARCCPHAGIWGGRTLFADGRLNPASCWQRMTLWNLACRAAGFTGLFPDSPLFNAEAYGGWRRDSVRRVDIVSGCFLLVELSFWHRLGGFDPAFFMYGEDADLCLRAQRHGATPLITPDATIVHHGGASERVRADKMVRLLAAKSDLVRRHMSPVVAPLAHALLAAWPLSRFLANAIALAATGTERRRPAALCWQEIWARRAEWRRGYAAPVHQRADALPSTAVAQRG